MKAIRLTRCLMGLMAIWSIWANGQSPAELGFKGKYDQFDLLRVGSNYQLAGKPAKLGPFEEFLNLFRTQIEGACPTLKKPDMTVTAKIDGQAVVRKFYVAEHIVSDGKQCATVSGDGIFFIPLHRSWFEENGSGQIAIKSPLKVSRGEETLAAFAQTDGSWRNTVADRYPNWEFFSSFRDNVAEFPITVRVHKAAVGDTPGFVLTSGTAQIKFYKFNGSWLALLPQTPWLVGSSRWTNWADMDPSQWLDRNAPQLLAIANPELPLAERRSTLSGLEGQWTPSIRDLLIKLLHDPDTDLALKLDAVRMMKSKPVRENMAAMIEALSKTNNEDLLYALTTALKVRNPKGRVINTDTEDRSKIIADWQAWWNEYKRSKDAF